MDTYIKTIAIMSLGGLAAVVTYKRWSRSLTAAENIKYESVISRFNEPSPYIFEDIDDKRIPGLIVPRVVAQIAREVKEELANPSYTEANVIIVHKFIVKEMARLHVRKCDRNRILAYATKLSFMKTKDEIDAEMGTASDVFQKQWSDSHRSWFALNPLGWLSGENLITRSIGPKRA